MKNVPILGTYLKEMTKNQIKAEYLKKDIKITREDARDIKKKLLAEK